MRADIIIPAEECSGYSIPELRVLLKKQHVIFGINEYRLREIATGKCAAGAQTVANGTPMVPGTPGRLEWFIDLSKAGTPRILDDGSVDLRDLQTHLNVAENHKLVRRIPPVPGKPGMTVFGTSTQPPTFDPVDIVAGKGTRYDENDRQLIRSAIEGAVVFDGRTIRVINSRIVKGDVDYATGNILFSGDVEIAGSVRAGFCIEAKGDVIISGNIEDARITAGGSVRVKGGAVGSGGGAIICKDSLSVHHASKFTLTAEKGVHIREDSLHCAIHTDGTVKARSIIGGTVKAFEVIAEHIGSSSEVRTTIDIARNARLVRERYDLLKRFGTLSASKAENLEKMYTLVRDGMDERGYIHSFEEQILATIKQTTLECIQTCRELQVRLEMIEQMEEGQGEATIIAGNIHPNTILMVGLEERMVKNQQRNVCIKAKRN
jgi:uncharacterized protein (DUF342 family)